MELKIIVKNRHKSLMKNLKLNPSSIMQIVESLQLVPTIFLTYEINLLIKVSQKNLIGPKKQSFSQRAISACSISFGSSVGKLNRYEIDILFLLYIAKK